MPEPTPTNRLEHVRRRPGMYIGGTDQRALNSCVFELIANSIEEHLAGRASFITITIHNDGSLSVKDDGGGIAVDLHPQHKLPFIELAMTSFIANDHHKHPFRVLGMCGVGTICVNAVSEWMRINTVWKGDEFQIGFARGQISEPLRKLPKPATASGTLIRFKPDMEIFKAVVFDRNFLANRLDALAVLHPKLVFLLMDERPNLANRPLVSLFHYPGGIAEFLSIACPPDSRRHKEPVTVNVELQGVKVALGFQFTYSRNTSLLSFVNSSPTQLGGTHVQGFLEGLADAVKTLPASQEFNPANIPPGLHAIIAVWLENPHYGGATKDELINPEVEEAVCDLVANQIKDWVAKYAELLVESSDEECGE